MLCLLCYLYRGLIVELILRITTIHNIKSMIKNNKISIALCASVITVFAFSGRASAQEYKTPADTVKLNKEYAEVTHELAVLNSRLTEQQNKTESYQAKAEESEQDAASSAQGSKKKAARATNGKLGDAKKAAKQAKRANNEAIDARDAMNDQKENEKEINDLSKKIEKKKRKLAELDEQRAAIMLQADPATVN